jgi:predicted SAM-dependent methyltransferase
MIINTQDFGSNKVHLGCGKKYLEGWINVDALPDVGSDVCADLNAVEFLDGSVETVYACHVLEHLNEESVCVLLRKIFRWLRPCGALYVAVPDFDAIHHRYSTHRDLSELRGLILGGGRDEYDVHRSIFNFEKLKSFLEYAEFRSIDRYDWRDFEVGQLGVDDYSQAYLPHLDKINGQLMSLNVVARR